MPNVIYDGYTEKFYVKAHRGLYEAVRGTYRPPLMEESSEFLESGVSLTPSQADRATAEFLAKRILTWDVRMPKDPKNPSGPTVVAPITPDTLIQLGDRSPLLFRRLTGIVLRTQASDEDPEAGADEKKRLLKTTQEAAQTGDLPGVIEERADQKN